MDKIKDLIDATYAEDEPAMVKIIENLTEEEFMEFLSKFTTLNKLLAHIVMMRMPEFNEYL